MIAKKIRLSLIVILIMWMVMMMGVVEIKASNGDENAFTSSMRNEHIGPINENWSANPGFHPGRVKPLWGIAEDDAWYLVELVDGRTGWVEKEHISYMGVRPIISRGKSYSAQTVSAEEPPSELQIRTGPAREYSAFAKIAPETEVAILAEKDQWLPLKMEQQTKSQPHDDYNLEEASPEEQPLQGITVALDPGHGGRDPGAVGITGLPEKEVALKTTIKLKKHLKEQGASVALTRSTDLFLPLSQRVNIAHKEGADILISVHANSHPQNSISGTETYYYRWGGQAQSSRTLAEEVQREMIVHSGLRDIGVKHGDFHVIRAPHIPSILIELGFLSNAHDEDLLRQDAYLEGQAQAITRGIVYYYNKTSNY